MIAVQLLPIDEAGTVASLPSDSLPEMMRGNCQGTASFYGVVGFEPPGIGYVSRADGTPAGGGAFPCGARGPRPGRRHRGRIDPHGWRCDARDRDHGADASRAECIEPSPPEAR